MITDDDLDQRLSRAFDRLEELPVDPPEFSTSVSRPRRRHRQFVAAAASVIAIAGVIGVTRLSETDTSTTADVEATSPATALDPAIDMPNATPPSSVSDVPVVALEDAPYRCVGFIGSRGGDRIYDDCEPMTEYVMVDYVCSGYAGTDANGFDGLANCDAIAATSNVPGINSLPQEIIAVGPGRFFGDTFETSTYVIQPGDIPIAVAEAHCLTLDQLNRLNVREAAYPSFQVGAEILVPTTSLERPCRPLEEQTYLVQSGDWPLKVADEFCISLADLITYNGWVGESDFPFPGTPIAIPPGSCDSPDE